MISFTLENILIITIFQLLVSGLILCGTGAVLYLQKDPFVRKILKLVGAAFCLYSLHLLLRVVHAYQSLPLASPASLPLQWEFLAQALETAALMFLGFAYLPYWLPERLRGRFWAIVAAVVSLLIAGPYLALQLWPAETSGVLSPALVNAFLLGGVAALHFRRKGRKALFSAAPLCVLAVGQFLRAASQGPGNPEWLWVAENAAILVGLGLFLLVVDTRSENLQVHFFLRLNLTFVAIACLLILIVAETERREYLIDAESHSEALGEFLRGHLIYFHNQGLQPPEILSSPEITHKITAEFSRVVDLRRVRVSFQGWHMEMSIGEDWIVTHKVYPEAQQPRPQRTEEWGRVVTLTPIPVLSRGRLLGRIELDQGLRSINARVGHQMRIIFLTLTAAVFIAAVLFGFTARRANKTIQRQFEELETTHEQLADAARLASVGQLAGGVAHEINNPAGIILTTSDYLLSEAEKQHLQDDLREDLQVIRRQARRISNVVSELLTFSRPTLLDKQATNINTVLQQSLALLVPRFRELRVQAEQRLTENLPSVTADSDRLEQVFVNLLNNAADAMPEGGKVSVESAACQVEGRPCLVVSIADTGSGISEEHLKRIFDPFFSTKPKGQGTGLGLSVSYNIIRGHGGQIEVESRVDRGTVFRVRLPTDGTRDKEL